jgi:signal transduction histidine kinase
MASTVLNAHAPDPNSSRFGANLRRSVLILMVGTLTMLWSGYTALTLSERVDALNESRDDVAAAAAATLQYALLLPDAGQRPLLGIQPVGTNLAAGTDPATRAMATFLAGLHLDKGMWVSLTTPLNGLSNRRSVARSDGITLSENVSDELLSASARSPDGTLIATASIKDADALSNWRSGAIVEGLALIFLTAVFGIFTLLFLRQLRQREEAAAALYEAKDMAEAGSRAKSDFLANMSHELRTPLNAIIGFSELLRNELYGPLGNRRYHEYADDIFRSGRHLLGLINDVLDISRLNAGELHVNITSVDLRECFDHCIRSMEPLADKANVRLSSDLDVACAPVLADPQRLRQVLLNLLSNAIKFTPEGGAARVEARCQGDMVSIAVSDTGIGISDSDIPRVLERFGQVETSLSRRYDGSGLGLPIAKRLVELQGGSFSIQSEVGVGTTVTVTFMTDRAGAASEAA